MFNSLSDKYKFYLLVAAFAIALIICYNLAIRGTLQSLKNCRNMKEKARLAAEMPQKAALLRNQLTTLNNRYFDGIKSLNDAHEAVLEKLSKLSLQYSTSVTGYPARHIYETSVVQAETHTAILKGGFINLLHVLYSLEVSERVGRIASVEYYTETDYRTKITSLYSRIYIQNFRNIKRNGTQ